ncbi:MFS transporter [Streptomyces sp. S1D4-11]
MLHDKPPQPPLAGSAPTTLKTPDPSAGPGRMSGSVVLWVALAIFAQESVWNFYDAQVPAQLRHFVSSATVIGLIMGLDTGLGVIIQPWMGLLSDKLARSRAGRWPIIVAGACVAAVPFALIPWATSLPMLMLCVFSFGLTANSFKGVTETLVSDYVAPQQRGKAQGFIKAWRQPHHHRFGPHQPAGGGPQPQGGLRHPADPVDHHGGPVLPLPGLSVTVPHCAARKPPTRKRPTRSPHRGPSSKISSASRAGPGCC